MKIRQTALLFSFLGITLAALYFGNLVASSANDDAKVTDEPASQGRKITPAGTLILDETTGKTAVGSLPVDFVRSPDKTGKDGQGRFLLAINSGFGLQFSGDTNRGQQSVSVIDLNAEPTPKVIQNVYFPSPQSANFGARFSEIADADGSFRLFIAGGFENKIWIFKFSPDKPKPMMPASDGKDTKIKAEFIDVSGFAINAPSPLYNDNAAAVYPTGIAVSPDANTVFSANNLGDSLGIVSDLRETRRLTRVSLGRPGSTQFVYPYDVEIIPAKDGKNAAKAYVSLWGDANIAVVDLQNQNKVSHIAVERHPTAMILNRDKTLLFVVNSNADSVSVIDTKQDKLIENINLKLAESARIGASPEGLALSNDEKTLYIANAHANAVAVVSLESGVESRESKTNSQLSTLNSQLKGFIPTGQYASAIAVVGNKLFVANGKGTGVENSSLIVNNSGFAPNAPNALFPPKEHRLGGQYSVSLVVGNISYVAIPDERKLFDYTQQVMRNNELLGERKTQLFKGATPIKHIIYIIRENRTYDQVFGDLRTSGDGRKADGDERLAIFGAGETAKSPGGKEQNITPNARALAQRFGLLDRFFVNAEASPDGHNWSTAAFSNDYVDKAFRWDYSGRGRGYDYEGFNRLPIFTPNDILPPVFDLPVTEKEIVGYMQKFVPYRQGNRDIAEPETLYLWDAAQRKGLTYRNYGEFLGTISENDVKEVNTRKDKTYPDISMTLAAFPTKKTLENHFNPTYRNFDLYTPDIMTTDSYKSFQQSDCKCRPEITEDNPNPLYRGNSRFGEWQKEFKGFVTDLNSGKPDRMPNLSIMHVSNDHTNGYREKTPTPQFYVAENDYAVGRLVEEVSNSPYWKDTAIFIVEDDAQDGPDHVDAHRSPALIISAYNRKGALIHDFHNTVSMIRTMEILLGLDPMNLLDATASPMDIFTDEPDLSHYAATLPKVALDNLFPPAKTTAEMRAMMRLTEAQNFAHADLANPEILNKIIWFSVRGEKDRMPETARLPVFDLMTAGLYKEADEEETAELKEQIEQRRQMTLNLAKETRKNSKQR
ncbi:MAG: alkaline phosphatase family protein [Actinomycetota bacterium]